MCGPGCCSPTSPNHRSGPTPSKMSSDQVAVSNHTSPDAALLWPTGQCDDFAAQPILPNTTSSEQICGVQSTNASIMAACCDGAEIQQYQCWTYCGYTGSFNDLVRCVAKQRNASHPDFSRAGVFCEGNITMVNTKTLNPKTSAAFRQQSTPRVGWIVLAVLFSILFITPASAAIIPSLDDGTLAKRQDSNSKCTFTIQNNYTSRGLQQVVTQAVFCQEPRDSFCHGSATVDTDIANNNRVCQPAHTPKCTN